MTFEWTADKSKQAPASEGVGAWGEFWRAAAYSGAQEPLVGLAQIADRVTGKTKLAESIHLVDAPPTPKNGLEQHALMLGSAVGSLVPIGLSALASRFALGGLATDAGESLLLKRGSLGLNMVETGTTGAFVGGFLSPTDDAANKSALGFVADRALKAGVSGVSFAGMSAINAGLASEAVTSQLSRVGLSSVARNPVLNGIVSGIPAGGFNAEVDSLVNRHDFASKDEVLAGMYQMSLTGGVFGATNMLAKSLRAQPAPTEKTADSQPAQGQTSQRSAGVSPAQEQRSTEVAAPTQADSPEKIAPPDVVPAAQRQSEAEQKIVAAFDSSAGSDRVSEYKRGRDAVDALKQLPEEDKYPVWRSLIQRSHSDPKYAELGRAISTNLELLPEEHRLPAWNDLGAIDSHWVNHARLIGIQHLAPEHRLAAMEEWLPGNEDNYFLGDQLYHMPAETLPAIAERYFKWRDDDEWRAQNVRLKPLLSLARWTEDMHDLPVAKRTEIVDKVLTAGFEHGIRGDEMPLQDMWRNLPEPRETAQGESATPIRDQLVRKYSPEDLSKVTFSWADPEIVRPFARENPDLIKAIASRSFEKTGPDDIRQIEMIALAAQTQESFSGAIKDTLQSIRRDLPESSEQVVPQMISELAKRAPASERAAALDVARDAFLKAEPDATKSGETDYAARTARTNAFIAASLIGAEDPQLLHEHFLRPVEQSLHATDGAENNRLLSYARIASGVWQDLPASRDHIVRQSITRLAKDAPVSERAAALDTVRDTFLNAERRAPRENAFKLASFIGEANNELLQKHFLRPLEDTLSSASLSYPDKLTLYGRIASIEHSLRLENMAFRIPDLRLPKQDIGVEASDLPALRSRLESQLGDSSSHERLVSDLAALFPPVFGQYEKTGGFAGRRQSGIHKFPLDEHSRYVVGNVLNHPEFGKLSQKDRTNLLWAALMHDAAKRAFVPDPGHEWGSANLAWGVLRSLGYPLERIQRIAALISRHAEVSYTPHVSVSERFKQEPDRLTDLATFYRHPSAARQLAILNEADIRSIAPDSQYWKPAAADEVGNITNLLEPRARELSANSVPILTSSLPSKFKLAIMDKPYALLAHVSNYLDGGEFLRQLYSIETPQYSISSSLITNENRRFFTGSKPTVVALVSGPFENISQAWRANLGTGYRVDWNGHVRLTENWLDGTDKYSKGPTFAHELDRRAREAGIEAGDGDLSALKKLQDTVSQYDSLDELIAEHGEDSPIVKAQRAVFDALTQKDEEQSNRDYNEVKLNSPTVVGLGINREGQPVYLENLTDKETIDKLLGGEQQPDWLVTGNTPPPNARVVPENVWREALRRDLPLVILDP